jgi:hypothetical protein
VEGTLRRYRARHRRLQSNTIGGGQRGN